jgi:hypothetical protein
MKTNQSHSALSLIASTEFKEPCLIWHQNIRNLYMLLFYVLFIYKQIHGFCRTSWFRVLIKVFKQLDIGCLL